MDKTQEVVDFGSGNGPFERMAALMGFENALISMAAEPEASAELLSAITGYKLKVIEREVHRCIDTYGKYKGYIFFGFVLSNSLDPAEMMKILGPLVQESVVYAHMAAGK